MNSEFPKNSQGRRLVENATGMRLRLTFAELISSLKRAATQNIISTFCRFTHKTILNAEWEGPEATINPSRCPTRPAHRLSLLTAALPEAEMTPVPASRSPSGMNISWPRASVFFFFDDTSCKALLCKISYDG